MNRRGFNLNTLKSNKLLHPEEFEDYLWVIDIIKKENPNCNFYLMGTSAGSSYGAKLLGEFSE